MHTKRVNSNVNYTLIIVYQYHLIYFNKYIKQKTVWEVGGEGAHEISLYFPSHKPKTALKKTKIY